MRAGLLVSNDLLTDTSLPDHTTLRVISRFAADCEQTLVLCEQTPPCRFAAACEQTSLCKQTRLCEQTPACKFKPGGRLTAGCEQTPYFGSRHQLAGSHLAARSQQFVSRHMYLVSRHLHAGSQEFGFAEISDLRAALQSRRCKPSYMVSSHLVCAEADILHGWFQYPWATKSSMKEGGC